MSFKFSEETKAKRNIWSSKSQLKHWRVARYVLPGLLRKPTDNERRQKILKKPAAMDRADEDPQKMLNKPKCNFHGKSP